MRSQIARVNLKPSVAKRKYFFFKSTVLTKQDAQEIESMKTELKSAEKQDAQIDAELTVNVAEQQTLEQKIEKITKEQAAAITIQNTARGMLARKQEQANNAKTAPQQQDNSQTPRNHIGVWGKLLIMLYKLLSYFNLSRRRKEKQTVYKTDNPPIAGENIPHVIPPEDESQATNANTTQNLPEGTQTRPK